MECLCGLRWWRYQTKATIKVSCWDTCWEIKVTSTYQRKQIICILRRQQHNYFNHRSIYLRMNSSTYGKPNSTGNSGNLLSMISVELSFPQNFMENVPSICYSKVESCFQSICGKLFSMKSAFPQCLWSSVFHRIREKQYSSGIYFSIR